MTSKRWLSPTGHEIIGTADTLLATACISDIEADGTPVYVGESKIHWDSQACRTRDGRILFEDANGDEWTFDQLTQEDAE